MVVLLYLLLVKCVFTALSMKIVEGQQRSFEIDYKNDVFLKDGKPFRYMSGSLHYFRVPRAYWRDRLRKYRAAGLNAISTYIDWHIHEPTKGKYDFSGNNDFEAFIRMAQEEEMLVILRPGPYINSERDFGAYPAWLLHENPKMGLRTNESSHTHFVYSWFTELFPRIQPLLYGNGGPVIMVQVENEFGSDGNDRNYTKWLKDVVQHYVGNNAVLFTTDNNILKNLERGAIPGVLATVDFMPGGNITQDFNPLRQYQPHGPLVNSELYPGWMSHWGEHGPDSTSTSEQIVKTLRQFLNSNVSFNILVFHGGTNFGFSSGADCCPYKPVTTSYDFNAPISESGNLTEKYYAIKEVLTEHKQVQEEKSYNNSPHAYGLVVLQPKISLFDSDKGIVYGSFSQPKSFESLQLYTGFMLYETELPTKTKLENLEVGAVHDRTIVFVDQVARAVFGRLDDVTSIELSIYCKKLSILVENQGHICFSLTNDIKGLLGNVTLNGAPLGPWKHRGYPLTNVSSIPALPTTTDVKLPAFFSGSFKIPESEPLQDTFVDMTGWGKGVLYINDHNLGRYWPTVGPQITLYLPAPFLRQDNVFVILELEREHPNRTISLVDMPILYDYKNVSRVDLKADDISVSHEIYNILPHDTSDISVLKI